jgi:hypothetical protein
MESTYFVFYPYVPLLPPNDACVALAFSSQNHGATNMIRRWNPQASKRSIFFSVQAALNDRGPKMKAKGGYRLEGGNLTWGKTEGDLQ